MFLCLLYANQALVTPEYFTPLELGLTQYADTADRLADTPFRFSIQF